MKLYFMVALVIAAVHMGLAAFLKPQQYECPDTKIIILCPHDDPAYCARYCPLASANHDTSTHFGHFCYNTNPIMFCAYPDLNACTRYCQGAARATSLTIAGQ